MRGLLNPYVRRDDGFRGLFGEAEYDNVAAYFAARPDLRPTPLRSLPTVAAALGISHLAVKDETQRFGLNAFKILGVRYAASRLDPAALARGLVCATAGNHGRAVARVAREQGVRCTIFVPAPAGNLAPEEQRTRDTRIGGMRADGAEVVEVAGTYEDAVHRAREHAEATGATVLSDTSWPGYAEIPRWIMAGYTRLFDEAAAQWQAPPDLVLVQAGVGGLLAAAASWFAWHHGAARPYLVGCEPEAAACLLESTRAAAPARLNGPHHTIMAGLRCAEPSPAAWPALAGGVDAFVAIADDQVLDTMSSLAQRPDGERLTAGPSGACGLAALAALARAPELAHVRHASGLDRSTRALVVVTEG